MVKELWEDHTRDLVAQQTGIRQRLIGAVKKIPEWSIISLIILFNTGIMHQLSVGGVCQDKVTSCSE